MRRRLPTEADGFGQRGQHVHVRELAVLVDHGQAGRWRRSGERMEDAAAVQVGAKSSSPSRGSGLMVTHHPDDLGPGIALGDEAADEAVHGLVGTAQRAAHHIFGLYAFAAHGAAGSSVPMGPWVSTVSSSEARRAGATGALHVGPGQFDEAGVEHAPAFDLGLGRNAARTLAAKAAGHGVVPEELALPANLSEAPP